MLDIRWVGELRYGQITLHVIGFIRKVADSFPSILLFCQSFSISRLIKGLVRISGKRHARVSNDLTLRWIRYPRTYTQRHTTTVLQRGGGGGGLMNPLPCGFWYVAVFRKDFAVESFSSSRQDEAIISWVVALLETCNVTNMAAILDLPVVRNQVKTERIGIFFFLDMWSSLGSTSVNGPGSLVHFGSLKCIHPVGGGDSVSEGNKLMIFAGCSESRWAACNL